MAGKRTDKMSPNISPELEINVLSQSVAVQLNASLQPPRIRPLIQDGCTANFTGQISYLSKLLLQKIKKQEGQKRERED